MIRSEDGMHLVPESYAVPADCVAAEYKKPGSQPREVVGRCPFLWGQSLYILGKLLQEVTTCFCFSNFSFFFCTGISGRWRTRSAESAFGRPKETGRCCSSRHHCRRQCDS